MYFCGVFVVLLILFVVFLTASVTILRSLSPEKTLNDEIFKENSCVKNCNFMMLCRTLITFAFAVQLLSLS